MKTAHTLELQIEYLHGLREDLTGAWAEENCEVIDSAIATLQGLLEHSDPYGQECSGQLDADTQRTMTGCPVAENNDSGFCPTCCTWH